MKKTKKSAPALSKTLQLTFITVVVAAFLIEATHWVSLLVRVYPNGMRFSQFSTMAIGAVVLPILLAAISLFVHKTKTNRIDYLFNSALLTVIGLGIYRLVFAAEWKLLQQQNLYNPLFEVEWRPVISIVISIVLFIALLLVLARTSKKTDYPRKLQLATIGILLTVFIVDSTSNLIDLISRHVGTKDIMNFLTHFQFVTPVALPLIFLLAAFFILPKTGDRLQRLFSSVMYALVGYIVTSATMIATFIVLALLPPSQSASLYTIDFQTIAATIMGVAIFTALLLSTTRSKKATKKAK